jgi:hypothetical protein
MLVAMDSMKTEDLDCTFDVPSIAFITKEDRSYIGGQGGRTTVAG